MPFDSTPRIAATFSTMPFDGTVAPAGPKTPSIPGARIRCAADDLQGISTCIDGQHLQLVGLRMRRGGQHLGDAEGCEFFSGIFDALDFEADAVERVGNRVRHRHRYRDAP